MDQKSEHIDLEFVMLMNKTAIRKDNQSNHSPSELLSPSKALEEEKNSIILTYDR